MKNELNEYIQNLKNVNNYIESNKNEKDLMGELASAYFLIIIEAYMRSSKSEIF